MSTIELEDELIVDFCLCEGPCIDHKQAYKHKHQEIATVNLQKISSLNGNVWTWIVYLLDAIDQTLQSKHQTSGRENTLSPDTASVITCPGYLRTQLANSDFVVTALKVSGVKVFHVVNHAV